MITARLFSPPPRFTARILPLVVLLALASNASAIPVPAVRHAYPDRYCHSYPNAHCHQQPPERPLPPQRPPRPQRPLSPQRPRQHQHQHQHQHQREYRRTRLLGFVYQIFQLLRRQHRLLPSHNMQLWLQVGATQGSTSHPFNATLEVDASDAPHTVPVWVPYNRFVGIDDTASWVTQAPLRVRELPNSSPAPTPYPLPPPFIAAQLATETPAPAVYMKADPRSTRFGIFQMDTNPTAFSRIVDSLWPTASATLPNGYGGNVVDPGGPVEHAPNRFCRRSLLPGYLRHQRLHDDARDVAPTTTYPDNDSVTRPADAIYPGAASHTGESVPYSNTSYRPIMLNRPFRNVAELGYAFRDLPWKTLDFFTDKSADAGLLDIFSHP